MPRLRVKARLFAGLSVTDSSRAPVPWQMYPPFQSLPSSEVLLRRRLDRRLARPTATRGGPGRAEQAGTGFDGEPGQPRIGRGGWVGQRPDALGQRCARLCRSFGCPGQDVEFHLLVLLQPEGGRDTAQFVMGIEAQLRPQFEAYAFALIGTAVKSQDQGPPEQGAILIQDLFRDPPFDGARLGGAVEELVDEPVGGAPFGLRIERIGEGRHSLVMVPG